MREELEMFVKYVVNSLSKLHLILFFYRNRDLPDTVDGITRRTGLNKDEARETLRDLLLSEIVSRYNGSGETFWFYNPSRTKETLVEEIISLYDSPQGRETIVSALLSYSGKDTNLTRYGN